jgi:hypothetical protein
MDYIYTKKNAWKISCRCANNSDDAENKKKYSTATEKREKRYKNSGW